LSYPRLAGDSGYCCEKKMKFQSVANGDVWGEGGVLAKTMKTPVGLL
jgi:hypothetical protein